MQRDYEFSHAKIGARISRLGSQPNSIGSIRGHLAGHKKLH
jgi:hypothetical protein